MSDQDAKSVDFNPLDILASAAATLKQVDKSANSAMTQQRQSITTEQRSNSVSKGKSDGVIINEGVKSNKNCKNQDNKCVKKIRVVTKLSSDLEKMLDEHNYGNSRRNLLEKSLTGDTPPGGSSDSTDIKDRKVLVTVVNKTGDHLIGTIKNIKLQEDASIDNRCYSTADTETLPEAVEIATDISDVRCCVGEQVNKGIAEKLTESTVDVSTDNCHSSANVSPASTQSTGSASPCRSCGVSDNENDGNQHWINFDNDKTSHLHHKSNAKTVTTGNISEKCSENETDDVEACRGEDVIEETNDMCKKCNNATKDDSDCQSTSTETQNEKCDNKINSSVLDPQINEKSHIHLVSVVSKPDTLLSQPQTVVINISHNKESISSQVVSPTSKKDNSSSKLCDDKNEKLINQDTKELKNNIVRSLLTCEKEDVKCPDNLAHAGVLREKKNELIKEKNPTFQQQKIEVSSQTCSSENECKLSESESTQAVILDNAAGDNDCKFECVNVKSEEKPNSSISQVSVSIDDAPLLKEGEEENAQSHDTVFLKKEDGVDNECLSKTEKTECVSIQTDTIPKDTTQTECDQQTDVPSIDHCYAGTSEPVQPAGQQRYTSRKNSRLHSSESLLSDLSQDSGFGELGNSPGTPVSSKSESYRLRTGSESTSPECKRPTRTVNTSPLLTSPLTDNSNKISTLLEMGSSGMSSLQDLNDVNKTRDAIIALVQSSESLSTQNVAVTPVKSNIVSTLNDSVSPKVGKYRIGTFASVSKSTFGLESPKKRQQGFIDAQTLVLTQKTVGSTSLLSKMNGTGKSMLPHIVPSQMGTGSNGNNTGKLTSVTTQDGLISHVEHDHDYCLPAAAMSSSPHLMAKLLKDTVFLKQASAASFRDKRSDSNDSYKRPRKVSVSASDLSDSMDVPSPSSVTSDSPLSPLESATVSQPSITTRQKAKSEKAAEYVRSGNSASKLKITGKYQDDYIYFLNTKVRSRRRTNSQDIPTPVPPDRIIVPAPKPGDIVVPHLTDADLEAIKHGQHASVKPPSSLNLLGSVSTPSTAARSLSLTSTTSRTTSSSVAAVSSPTTATASGTISDEESKIINTILSMENDDTTATAGTVVTEITGETDSTVATAPPLQSSDGFPLSLFPEQLNLTTEQMEILYSAMDEVQSLSPDLTPSGDKSAVPPGSNATGKVDKEEDKAVHPLKESLADTDAKPDEEAVPESTIPTSSSAGDSKLSETPLADSSTMTGETALIESGKSSSETDNLVSVPASSTISSEIDSVSTNSVTPAISSNNSQTVNCILQSGSVKSLSQDTCLQSTNKPDHVEPTASLTSVRSLLQADRNTVKSLLTNSVEVTNSSVVNTMPDMPFTSLDKSSLDLFGNDLKLFPETSVSESKTSTKSNVAIATTPVTSADHNAPWIVTVSMFWNDLPAIMINNLPFVRLVDIHKQILPAKDTGILKKRCQLLGINVANCTEMQRYFLVQYGKAFNSKSTLIVGKDDAKVLIGYYVNPVPKPPRGEEARITERAEDPRPVHNMTSKSSRSSAVSKSRSQIVEQRMSVPVVRELPGATDDNSIESPIVSTAPTSPGIVSVIKTEPSAPLLTVGSTVSSLPQQNKPPQGHQRISQRTRHKKINFLELLKGDANNNTTSSSVSPETGHIKNEDIEEKELPVQNVKIDLNEYTNEFVKGQKKAPTKRKSSPVMKAKEGTLKTDKAKKVCEEKELISTGETYNNGHTEDSCTGESEAENKVQENQFHLFVGKRGSKQSDREQMMKKLKTVKAKKPGSLKVKWTIFNKSNPKKSGVYTNTNGNNKNSDCCKSEILTVIHKDMVSRNGDKRRMQAGNVFLDQYNGKDAACVRCCTCKKLFTVDMFLTHLHEIGGNGKLLVVSQPQTIALRDLYPTENQKRLWQNFQKRRRALANVKNEDAKVGEESTQNDVLIESVKKVGHRNFNGMEGVVPNSVVKSRNSVPPLIPSGSTNNKNNVRISARKRKQKQLYPIENYSFARKVHQQQQSRTITNIQIESDGDEPMSPLVHNDSDSCNGSPSKMQKLMSLSSEDESSFGDTVSSGVAAKVMPESVLTLTSNGPEVISFTALQQDEGLDI